MKKDSVGGIHSLLPLGTVALIPLLVGLLGAAWLSSGCATSPRRVAYQTLGAVGHGVNAAVNGYFDSVVTGAVPTNGVPRVARSYEAFQVTYRLAVALAQLGTNAPATPDVTKQATVVLEAVADGQGGRP